MEVGGRGRSGIHKGATTRRAHGPPKSGAKPIIFCVSPFLSVNMSMCPDEYVCVSSPGLVSTEDSSLLLALSTCQLAPVTKVWVVRLRNPELMK